MPSEAPVEAPRSGALDVHKGISTPAGPEGVGCPRWPELLRLLSSDGELVRGRCRSTNQCEYCARLAAVENSELLALDALEGSAPQLWCVLTTPDDSTDPSVFYRSREKLVKALRRRWPDAEYAALVEFTTGYGPRSGGKRRPHWNLLLKGIPVEAAAEVREIIASVWCPRVGGSPDAQHVGSIADAGGLIRYIALHFQKQSQSPPRGWKGHRFLKSRGYLATDTPTARAAARSALALKRELWRAHRAGLAGYEAELRAQQAIARANATSWRMYWLPAALAPRSGVSPAPAASAGLGAGLSGPPSGAPVDARMPTRTGEGASLSRPAALTGV